MVVILVGLLAVGAARAEVMLFKGDPAPSAGLIIGGWGSGTAEESSEKVFVGSRSIRMKTQGLHEGGRIDLKDPIDLLAEPLDGTEYLQVVVSFTKMKTPLAGGGYPVPGVGYPRTGGVPTYWGSSFGDVEFATPEVSRVRVVLQASDGRSIESTMDVPSQTDEGWYKVAAPFKVLGLKQGETFPVARVLVFTDIADTVYVGQIGTVRDNTPITVNVDQDEEVVAQGDVITFRGQAEAGASMLRYSWNFGDRDKSGQPGGEDAVGEIVRHKFTKAGDFTVTLTVSDAWGIKEPATATVQVTVND